MSDMPKPTLLSRIGAFIFHRFGSRHYTYEFRLPLPCCEWCRSQDEIAERKRKELADKLSSLQLQINQLQKDTEAKATEVFKLKMEAAMKIFDGTMQAYLKQERIIAAPADITVAFREAFQLADELTTPGKPRQNRSAETQENAFHSEIQRTLKRQSTNQRNGHRPHAHIPDR